MDRKTILIYNSQAFGDCLIGTHAARFIKSAHPDSTIIFCVPKTFRIATGEEDENSLNEALDIISLQDCIDDVGIYDKTTNSVQTRNKSINGSIFKIYQQLGWYADLGIIKSALIGIAEEIGWDKVHTETKFSIGLTVEKNKQFTVAIPGPLDWIRKVGGHIDLGNVIRHLSEKVPNLQILPLGRDVSQMPYLEALRYLSTCHLYLGPIGSMATAAAGIGVDTISISDVFPPTFHSPEYYHSGNHHSVTAKNNKHCQSYKCVAPTYYKKGKTQLGNPPTTQPFWTQTCQFMDDKKSCIANITEEDIKDKIDLWFSRASLQKEIV